ncbi:toxin-activating lysine-acyltransferase [Pararhizobium sp. LjRoot255]|uniref:toxin-activating lysine-acyltransferase n=1 Tax=Pararhizobium sp. LjRoot255 TaxID=3342298 RepID=UPI003ECE079E
MLVGESSATPALRFYDVLGIMTALAFESELHRNWSVSDLQMNFIPAIILGHSKIYFNQERNPCAFATWALVDDQTHFQLLADGNTPRLEKWNSGRHLWFIDIVAPFGNALSVVRDLQRIMFPTADGAHSIYRNADGSVRRYRRWRNALSKDATAFDLKLK